MSCQIFAVYRTTSNDLTYADELFVKQRRLRKRTGFYNKV